MRHAVISPTSRTRRTAMAKEDSRRIPMLRIHDADRRGYTWEEDLFIGGRTAMAVDVGRVASTRPTATA